MSKTTIEKEIVQMEFDARKFRNGIKQSTDDLTAFKKSFDMKNAIDSFSEIEKASMIDFSSMASSLDSINNKMSLVGVAAGVMVAKITDGIISAGKSLADNLLLDPVTTGLEEYETQLNAVQTILANTQKQGTTLKDVNGALDELNTYADLTIYNFTQMTDNIGKFTAAGVELDTSVAAIKGISNLAALSGSNAQQASTAMYQLSQAISTGSLKLQDWNSVVNAGMGGQVFQDALMETARVHGVAVDNMIAQDGSFRESLSRGWITSEILLETLNKLTGDLTDAQLEQMGYSDEQIAAIQRQAETALDAATKIKTVTQLIDTMKEALQSGWSMTWRVIFGDFEEAKALWGSVAEILGGLIEEDAEARNRLLNAWSNIGGRDKLITAFLDLLKAGVNIFKAFKEAVGDIWGGFDAFDLLSLTKTFASFALKIRMGTNGLDNFKKIVRGVVAIIDIFARIIMAILRPILFFSKGVELVDGGLWALLGTLADGIVAWREWAIEIGWFDKIVANVVKYIKVLIEYLRGLVEQFFELDVVGQVVDWFRKIEITSEDLVAIWGYLQTILMAIAAPFYLVAVGVRELYAELERLGIIEDVVTWFNSLTFTPVLEWFENVGLRIQEIVQWFKDIDFAGVGKGFEDLVEDIKEFFTEIRESDVVESFLNLVSTFDGRRIKQFGEDAKEGFSWIETIKESDFGQWVGKTLDDAGAKAKELGAALLDGLKQAFDYFAGNADQLDYSHIFQLINTGLLAGLVLAFKKIASGEFISGIIDDSDFGEVFIDTFDRLEGTLGSFQNNIRADTLQKIAVSIAILAGSIFLLTLIDSTKLSQATGAIAVMVAALFGSAGALGRINHKDALQAALTIIGLSIAITILSVALRILSGIDPVEMQNGLAAMGVALVGLVAAVERLRTGTGTLKTILVMQGIALALIMLWGVIKLFGLTDPDVLAQGLAAVGAALLILSGSIAIIQKTATGDKNSSLKAALAMLGIAKAMEKLWEAVLKFGLLDLKVLIQGLVVIGLLLLAMTGFSKLIKPAGLIQAAVAMLIMAGSLLVIYEAIRLFGTLDMYDIFVSLVTIAAVLVMFALAANAMIGAIPGAFAILIVSAAMLVMAGVLKLLSTIDQEKIAIGILAIAAVLAVFIIAGYLMIPIVPVLIGFGLSLFLIGAGAALFGLGVFLAATALAALAGALALLAPVLAVVFL